MNYIINQEHRIIQGLKLISVYLFLFTVSLFQFSCSKNSGEKPQEENTKKDKREIVRLSKESAKEINLEISEISEGELSGAITASAKILPDQDLEAYVGSLVQGRVSKVFVNIGSYVKKGQTLMLIEGLQIGEIKAQFLKAKANLSYTEANFNRLKTLIEQNVGSQKSFLEAKAEYEKAKAEFNAEDKKIHSIGLDDKDIEESNSNDEHTTGLLAVKSPIEGTVVERNVVIGQLVESNTNSFRIINTSSLFADGQIYENELGRINGKPDITITTLSDPDNQFKGKIIYISDILDKETRTFKVRATVSNPDKKLKPEMFAQMHIPTSKPAKALIVPAEAVVKEGNESYVFIVVSDTSFEKRDVVTGGTQGENIEIKSGVKKGEKLVTKGTFMLKSEMKKEIFGSGD